MQQSMVDADAATAAASLDAGRIKPAVNDRRPDIPT